MEPYTASNIKARPKNVVKDFVHVAGLLKVKYNGNPQDREDILFILLEGRIGILISDVISDPFYHVIYQDIHICIGPRNSFVRFKLHFEHSDRRA